MFRIKRGDDQFDLQLEKRLVYNGRKSGVNLDHQSLVAVRQTWSLKNEFARDPSASAISFMNDGDRYMGHRNDTGTMTFEAWNEA